MASHTKIHLFCLPVYISRSLAKAIIGLVWFG
jgi:hypothetical protein